ncbi:YhgE/Pip domain-containing protein [Clostridium thermobutyricum]|uniref:YhgE/Pip domain-containing protein n=1 Tax=Clostridium thermobutyricum TaxID=29372 RepID=UPI00294285A8|nr:YhgE/Pip domain-containing protein [Clostridium thermobutyricum]
MKILKLYLKYLKNIVINPAAIVIILGLSLIPSCYTWITLKANWNPYVDTGNVPVAVVNDDNGAIINGSIVNFGDKIVDQLQNNTDMKWTFVGQKVADTGLKTGEYYAVITIPKDFSEDLKTISSGSPIKPDIIYKVNEKTNAIATKITDLAADQLQQRIKETFIKSVNLSLMNQANELGKNLNENKPMILGLKNVLNTTTKNISDIENNINNTNGNVEGLTNYLQNLNNNISSITNGINSLKSIVNSSSNLISGTRNNINSTKNDLSVNINNINSINNDLNNYINSLKNLNNISSNKKPVLDIINNAINDNNKLYTLVYNSKNLLDNLSNLDPTGNLNNLSQYLNKLLIIIKNENTVLNNLKTAIINNDTAEKINSQLDSVKNTSNDITNQINSFDNNFNSIGMNSIDGISNNLNSSLSNVTSILNATESMIPELKSIENIGISAGNLTVGKTQELSSKLNNLKTTLESLKDKTSSLNGNDLDKIINLLEKNPNNIASFLSAPVNIHVEELYGMSIFGVGLAPFYTVLSIWVGALLCTSLLTTNDEEEEDGTKRRLLQIHFGKMLLFLTINLVQAAIVTIGDVLVIGIKPFDFGLLMFFALFSAVVFTAIIFTLVSLTGNIGKATALVIMVIQVAGSGAIYPIQVNPVFFQKLQFIWPFTYAIDGFRQAIGGPDWTMVHKDILILSIFLVVFLLLGLTIMFIHKISMHTERLFKESGL